MRPELYFDVGTKLLFGAVLIGCVIHLRRRKRKSALYLALFTLFYIYIFKVLDYTLFQFQSLILLKHFIPTLMVKGQAAGTHNAIPLITLTPHDLKTSLLNILMLVPFGFGMPFITNLRLKHIVAIGALFSLCIEFLQFASGLVSGVTFRIGDINDVIFNTLGAAVGYLLFVIIGNGYRRLYKKAQMPANPTLRYFAERPQLASSNRER